MYEIDNLLNDSINELSKQEYSNFDKYLGEIGQLMQRNDLTASTQSIQNVLNYIPNPNEVIELRLFRALLVLIRNIATSISDENVFVSAISSFIKFSQLPNNNNEWILKTSEIYWQLLANFPRNTSVEPLNDIFQDVNDDFKSPIIHLLFRQFYTEDSTITNEKLLQLLKLSPKQNHLLEYIYHLYTTLQLHESTLDHDSSMLVHLLYDIITHESFGKCIQGNQPFLIHWLELTRDIIQTKDNWNNFELVALLSWNLEIFMNYSQLLIDNEDLNNVELESILVNNLNILAELSKFNLMKDFIKHQQTDFLARLIKLFKLLHNKISPIKLSDKQKIQQLKYPEVKTFIIIIISYLTYESFEIQEQIRTLGGLSLILSNCIIDDNNPFIKEQAIICLKYLLLNNYENQKFVGELEAKRVVDDQVLQEVGYEVEVMDGKVVVKKRN
ncbi:uncharacterized protein J8A68_005616 [[Candida] subhashii]|uniref:Ataxin-10 homolog n=1 Tax=[Candida] subhashii TaxID=561895 RepID=A0A8J5QGT6_9ASCO|nr:uncharacterized protein J8A68_005616 [[Candida] subhashii]KAG7660941.1 hypothetical protein J8A68_005616 [[Candida] subhashii]